MNRRPAMLLSRVVVAIAATVALASFAQTLSAAPLADPLKLDAGPITGAADEASGVRTYKGIPFAAPPVGDLRWKAPQPPAPWTDVRNCTEFGKSPIQPGGLGVRAETTSEDCLYLNVWTAAKDSTEKRPVMVWIYGGSYYMGSGANYDGTNLAKKGAVVLTINYRLGPLGFFSHPDLSKESGHNASGNQGILDQIESLKWVKRNIAAFGGDPDNVTIFGESAGSGSVSSIVFSPLAAGLFHRAIMESGTVATMLQHCKKNWYGQEPAEAQGIRIARGLNIAEGGDQLGALRKASPEDLLKVGNPRTALAGIPAENSFRPIVDGWVIPDDPLDLLAQGKFNKVPVIVGSNADEGVTFVSRYPEKTVAAYESVMNSVYGADAPAVKALYPVTTDADFLPVMNKHMAHSRFSAGARRVATGNEKANVPAYVYYFTRVSPGNRDRGAVHAAEIQYVFNRVGAGRNGSAGDDTDRQLADKMSTYWVNFAKTGNPNAAGLPEWPAYKSRTSDYLEFGNEVKAGTMLLNQQLDLFDRLTEERRMQRE